MSLLDTIVGNMSNGPRIVSEQHDARRINFVAGLSDPGEMIRCGYRQDLRRRDGETDAAYAERIYPLVMAMPQHERDVIMGASLRRASLDTTTGRIAVMVAGKPAWHELGVNVADAVDSADAIRLASMDWEASTEQLRYADPVTGEMRDAPGAFAVVRRDTGAALGTVGSRYVPIQNRDGFAFLDGVLGAFGAKYESCGSLYGGKKVWMLVRMPRQAFAVGNGDRVEPYAIFTNAHDGTAAAYCYPTTERVVCGNTFRIAQQGKGKGISIRHTGDIRGRMDDAREALGMTVEAVDRFADASYAMARTPANVQHYANDVLDAVLDVTEAQAKLGSDALAAALQVTEAQRELERKSFARKIERRGEILEDILTRYESGTNGTGGMRGTAWAGFNAVTESANHGKLNGRYKGSTEERASRRFESITAGAADDVMQVAYEKATALTA